MWWLSSRCSSMCCFVWWSVNWMGWMHDWMRFANSLIKQSNVFRISWMKQALSKFATISWPLSSKCVSWIAHSKHIYCWWLPRTFRPHFLCCFVFFVNSRIGAGCSSAFCCPICLVAYLSWSAWLWCHPFFTQGWTQCFLIICLFKLMEVPANFIEQSRVNELLDKHPHNHIRYLVSVCLTHIYRCHSKNLAHHNSIFSWHFALGLYDHLEAVDAFG